MGNRNNSNFDTPLNITAFDFCLDDESQFLVSLFRRGFSKPKYTIPTSGASWIAYTFVSKYLHK